MIKIKVKQMSVKEIEDKKNILHTLGKDELISYIHELLVNIKKSKNKVVTEKTEVRFLERQLSKIKDQIEKVLKTKVNKGDIWTPENIKTKSIIDKGK